MKQNIEKQQPIWRLRSRERVALLLFGDIVAAYIALFISIYLWSLFDAWLDFSLEFLQAKTPEWFFLLPLIWLVLIFELYDTRRASRRKETLLAISLAAAIGFGLYLIVYFTTDPNTPLPRIAIALFIPLCALFNFCWRYIYIKLFTTPIFMRRVIIVGAGKAGQALVDTIQSITPKPFILVGLLDDDPDKQNMELHGFQVLGKCLDLDRIIHQFDVTDIISAISDNIRPEILQSLINAEEKGIEVTTMPIAYEDLTGQIPVRYLKSEWLLRTFFDQAHVSESYILIKRFIDIMVSGIGLLALAATYPFIAAFIKVDSHGPIFLRQERIGKNGKPYTILKYRTMVHDPGVGSVTPTQKNDARITRIGKILRKSHIDELPQVLNILKSDMSVVGPRAEITSLVEMFSEHIPFYRSRLMVKPGLTGWAQIHQPYAATIEETIEKLEYDLYYIKHRSIIFDFHIMVRTASQVLGFRGR
jgi:exopolysaccharide biosynthesis polyprenyl glycosylphosphotransferase